MRLLLFLIAGCLCGGRAQSQASNLVDAAGPVRLVDGSVVRSFDDLAEARDRIRRTRVRSVYSTDTVRAPASSRHFPDEVLRYSPWGDAIAFNRNQTDQDIDDTLIYDQKGQLLTRRWTEPRLLV